jgi:hypothetical protein
VYVAGQIKYILGSFRTGYNSSKYKNVSRDYNFLLYIFVILQKKYCYWHNMALPFVTQYKRLVSAPVQDQCFLCYKGH